MGFFVDGMGGVEKRRVVMDGEDSGRGGLAGSGGGAAARRRGGEAGLYNLGRARRAAVFRWVRGEKGQQ